MLNDIMGDHGLLSGSETVKSTGMSDEDQSKFWSQVQKAEGAKVKRTKAKDEPTDLDEKAHVETVVEKGEGHVAKRCSKSLQRLALSVSHLQARA